MMKLQKVCVGVLVLLFSTVMLAVAPSGSSCASGSGVISGCSLQGKTNNSLKITSQKYYVIPKLYNGAAYASGTQYAYEVHFAISGLTDATTISIQAKGNKAIPQITVVNGKFSTDQMIRFYVSQKPNFQYKNPVTVIANFADGTHQTLNYTSGPMQVIIQ